MLKTIFRRANEARPPLFNRTLKIEKYHIKSEGHTAIQRKVEKLENLTVLIKKGQKMMTTCETFCQFLL